MQVGTVERPETAELASATLEEALDAKLIACWQAALNTDDPEESRRWLDMAEWLAHRDERPFVRRRSGGDERRRFPRVSVSSPALLALADALIRGETVNLSRTGACFACPAVDGITEGDQGIFSVRGWLDDRPARIVAIEPGQIRLVFI